MCCTLPEFADDCWQPAAQVGDHVDVWAAGLTPASVADWPSHAPVYMVYAQDGSTYANGFLPRQDWSRTGWFQYPLRMTTPGTAGVHSVLVGMSVSGSYRYYLRQFRLHPGGDADGTIIGLSHFRRPEAAHVMIETESGKIKAGRNPRMASNP